MKSTILSLTTACLLLSAAASAQPENKVRDPFLTPDFEITTPVSRPGNPATLTTERGGQPLSNTVDTTQVEVEAPEARVAGIVTSPAGRVALLVSEDRTIEVREGDQLGLLKVSRIQADKVVLSVHDQKFVLPFNHI